MRKVLIVVAVAIGAFALIAADGGYKKFSGQYDLDITTDDSGDSTTSSGSIGLGRTEGYSGSIMAQLIFGAASTGYAAYGLDDSAEVSLTTTFGNVTTVIAAETCAALPCTCYYVSIAAGLDTLIKDELGMTWYMRDTCSDTVATFIHPIKYNITLK